MVYLKRLFFRPDGQPIGAPTHLFFFITLIFGVAFAIPPEIFSTNLSQLYSFSIGAYEYIPLIWGLWLLVASFLNTLTFMFRVRSLATIVGMMGFTGWLYAGIAYVMTGYWLGLLSAALPCVLFWGWYYHRLKMWGFFLDDEGE